MFARLARYLTNNEAPKDQEIEELKKSRNGPMKERDDIDAEIERVSAILESLNQKRRIVEASITEYDIVLSPARHIPVDIWGAIFCRCLPTHRDALPNSSEAPLLLTRICTSWRTIAHTTPKLWSSLYLPFIDYGHPSFRLRSLNPQPLDTPAPHTSVIDQLIKTQCDIVQEWLSRSGSCPLSITITGQGVKSNPDRNARLLGLLAATADRWQDVEFNTFNYLWWERLIPLVPSGFPMLRELKIHSIYYYHEGEMPLYGLEMVPNLRSLSIGSMSPLVSNNDYTNHFPSTWTHLTQIIINCQLGVGQAVSILRLCLNVIELDLCIFADPMSDPNPGTALVSSLETLVIHEVGDLSNFYDSLQAPAVQTFVVYCSYGGFSFTQVSNYRSHPILKLLARVQAINKLIIHLNSEDISFTSTTFQECFRLSANLTHLVIYLDAHIASTHVPGDLRLSLQSLLPSHDLASATHSLSMLSLPNLEVFEIHNFNIDDQTLLDFILGRIHIVPDSGVAKLRRVAANFTRRRLIDIRGIVNEITRAKGISPPDLHFSYYADPPTPSSSLARAAIFGKLDDQSTWKFPTHF